VNFGERIGDIDGVTVSGGTVDFLAEQMVAGASSEGDVIVGCGTTLLPWAVIEQPRQVPGLWAAPHMGAHGMTMLGGASNAGGLFLNWATRLAGKVRRADTLEPWRVPVWMPYVRGERTPYHDPSRRASLHDLDLTHGAAALRRSAYEAAGFVARHHIELAGVDAQRIVATGGGTRVPEWMQALADCTGLPVDVVAVPEGAALGAAFQARMALGLEVRIEDAARWARLSHRVEPDAAWVAPCAERYARFRELSGKPE
jgi:xylulokinase